MAKHVHITPTPKRRRRSGTSGQRAVAAAPPIPPAKPRMMELIGLAEDGRMLLWDTQPVLPVSAFPLCRDGRRTWIKSGHYVIQWKGHAITVHCGNLMDGSVVVQFMCSRGQRLVMPRAEIEAKLLGLVHNPEADAEILRLLRKATKDLQSSQEAPDRQRGRI